MIDRLAVRAAAMLAIGLSAPAMAAEDPYLGVWSNPKGTVHVRSHHCGASMCGTVVWASDKAKSDAARGDTKELVGLQLFRDFRKDKAGNWRGKVFVPDINKTFSGSIKVVNVNTLTGSGCLVGRVGCKSQTWTRLP
ncbi:MAG: hypothetical protein ABS87_00040 [Sphingomonas sp. SCN 67-18]|uniref:DUF2147 domain-containing protein n=1 Tax=uncultured Sphingomonas sp. TaxID=158754 RepID=UPI00086F81DD|nr:DUF2147 domain-containing protein [Sphingomonas sp. SCN 67-18]ODU23003.1 MAG: hypothetical protein ABS87_00040 [Sphingomonas sp. SCN 67-18]